MWLENKIFYEDLEYITNQEFIQWRRLQNKTVFITGGTGLIGFYVINSLLFYNRLYHANIRVVALVRNYAKARDQFKSQLNENPDMLTFVEGAIEDIPAVGMEINYILHAASPTDSSYFLEKPVETIQTTLCGMWNVLELARKNPIEGMVYLSSMEVYGPNRDEEPVSESHASCLDTMSARSSYPESKRMCENLCASYYKEYQVPVSCIRLTQTFGPGIRYDDQRIFAMLLRCAMEEKDIELLTEGKTKRSYLYLADAATAILTVLTSVNYGQVYNAANEETYCSIKEMADLVASQIAKSSIEVIVNTHSDTKTDKFLPELKMNLSVDWLKNLGWTPHFSLANAFERTMKSLTDNTGGNL